jgi:hypothetical protein
MTEPVSDLMGKGLARSPMPPPSNSTLKFEGSDPSLEAGTFLELI